MFLSAIHRLRQDERGSVTFLVALAIPTLFLVAILAVDVGNWYVHKRELQTQADAGALAAAAYYKFPCNDAPIRAEAQKYAGGQLNNFSNVPAANRVFLLNAPDFSGQNTPNDTGLTGSPCADSAVDVKMTEHNVGLFFGTSIVPNINAQARVTIGRAEGLAGLMPIGVPAPDPKRIKVTFISEVDQTVLGSRELRKRSASQNGLWIWDNATDNGGSPLPLDFNGTPYARVGVRVALSGSTSTTTCGDLLVVCYDAGSADGLGFIRGWSQSPDVTDAAHSAPEVRSSALLPGTCNDAYFSDGKPCAIDISARVDFQPAIPAVDRQVTVSLAGGPDTPLKRDSVTGLWHADPANPLAIGANAGPVPITMKWEQTSGTVTSGGVTSTCITDKKNPCVGTFSTPTQRTFSAAPDRSGPIGLLQVGDQVSQSGANDLERCATSACHHDFVVTLGVAGSLELAKPTDPSLVLRRGGHGNSQTQELDCDPNLPSLDAEIAQGCNVEYRRNTGQACTTKEPNGTPPLYCAAVQATASADAKIGKGLNDRILCMPQNSLNNCQQASKPNSCTNRNHWPNWVPGDPRIVPVFVVPYGSFAGSGSGVGSDVPVQDFAVFYITGWTSNSGFSNPCAGNGDDPVPGNEAGYIVGHFIQPILIPPKGPPPTQACDPNSVSACTAVLTR